MHPFNGLRKKDHLVPVPAYKHNSFQFVITFQKGVGEVEVVPLSFGGMKHCRFFC